MGFGRLASRIAMQFTDSYSKIRPGTNISLARYQITFSDRLDLPSPFAMLQFLVRKSLFENERIDNLVDVDGILDTIFSGFALFPGRPLHPTITPVEDGPVIATPTRSGQEFAV